MRGIDLCTAPNMDNQVCPFCYVGLEGQDFFPNLCHYPRIFASQQLHAPGFPGIFLIPQDFSYVDQAGLTKGKKEPAGSV